MKRIGLALSGGGFRASLYHLGLIRFLRDAGILPKVSHITSVSGGSIVAAHLVLNWDRYNGSPNDFDTVASELLAFVRLGVRNRITRRFPLNWPFRWPRKLLGYSNRKLTRTGLLEHHYEKFLFGDVSLFELPEKPQLHILATNLSEGCLCSFNRNGLMMVRRRPGNGFRIDRVHVGLATVPMAVTASSAFPGFFPPLELTGGDVGASAGEFGRQAYTDGGVFDNLGVRMFRCLERPLLAESPLSSNDFLDFPAFVAALCQASKSSEETPLRRLGQILAAACNRRDQLLLPGAGSGNGSALHPVAESAQAGTLAHLSPSSESADGNSEAALVSLLWDVLRHHQFQREPLFAGLKMVDADAEELLHASRPGGRVLEAGDQLWLNRYLLEAAVRQATGNPCFRRLHSGLDGVLVSDVGKRIQVRGNARAGGVIRTAMRATDILMDRVWQLENETFRDTPGFVFAPITEVVEPDQDSTALHPEIQRQLANIRTDLDRFSLLEISGLIRHGYCVGRQACKAHPELFGSELPGSAPWDPVPAAQGAAPPVPAATRLDGPTRDAAPATVEARTLQASAFRRIWSTLLDRRDWTSYLYVPILIPILVLLPYFVVRSYQRSHRTNVLMESMVQSNRDFAIMSSLLEGPMKFWDGETAEEVHKLDERDFKGFEVLQDSRIIDMRPWRSTALGRSDASAWVYGYRRVKVRKLPDNTDNNTFRIGLLATSPKTITRFPPQQLHPTLRKCNAETTLPGQKEVHFEAVVDFQRIPPGEAVDIIYEHYSPGLFLTRGEASTTITFHNEVDTAEVTRWFLMPEGKQYRNFRILRYKTGKPETLEPVSMVTEYLAEDSSIIAYKLMSVKAGYTYEITWFYK